MSNTLLNGTVVDATSRVLNVARHEIGVREDFVNGHFNNRGCQVDEYQNADLLPGVGYSWCVSFVAWVLLTALGLELCDQVWLRSASCDSILDWGRRHGIVSSTPEPGCIGLVLASKNDATHGFIVEDVLARSCKTIEGNTNVDGGREGNGVYERTRVFSSRYAYLPYRKLMPAHFALPGKPTIIAPKPVIASPFATAPTLELCFGERRVDTVPVLANRSWVPAQKWATWMRADLGWLPQSQTVTLAGHEVPAQPILLDGRAWLPVRALAEFSGLHVASDATRVVVTR